MFLSFYYLGPFVFAVYSFFQELYIVFAGYTSYVSRFNLHFSLLGLMLFFFFFFTLFRLFFALFFLSLPFNYPLPYLIYFVIWYFFSCNVCSTCYRPSPTPLFSFFSIPFHFSSLTQSLYHSSFHIPSFRFSTSSLRKLPHNYHISSLLSPTLNLYLTYYSFHRC